MERQNGQSTDFDGPSLATIFDQKSKKWHPKRHPKIDAEKVSKFHAKMYAGAAVGSQLLDFGSQNLQNVTKTASKIFEISRLRRGYVFGAVLGAKRVLTSKFPQASATSAEKNAPKVNQREPKGSQRAQNGDQNPSKINEKSRLRFWNVFEAFLGDKK